MLTTFVFAQAAAASDPMGGLGLAVPMLLVMGIMFFMVIRPQQQKAKEFAAMIDKIRRGDTVVTSSGFVGRVSKVADGSDEVEVELSDQLKVRVLKSTLISVRGKNEPVKDAV